MPARAPHPTHGFGIRNVLLIIKLPETTRARLRGDFVRRANLRGWEYQVDWAYVRTMVPTNEMILCPDPFLAHDERVDRLAA